MVPRSALDHYVQWMTDVFEISPHDRFSQHPNLAFDISMTDIFGALCHGATLYPLLREVDRLMPARMIEREKITVWNSVPSVVSLMMQAGQATAANLVSVRLFNFCGEPLLPEQLEALFAARPDVLVRNTYGPTEATIAVTDLRKYDHRLATITSVAIGVPISNVGIHLIGGRHAEKGQVVICSAASPTAARSTSSKSAAAPATISGSLPARVSQYMASRVRPRRSPTLAIV
jgi:D-alanine--poly(phosphoribitol) ligase subunit 1